jgi:hypothetical protein
MFLLASAKSGLRQTPPLFANSREFQGFGEGFERKSSTAQPLYLPQTYV